MARDHRTPPEISDQQRAHIAPLLARYDAAAGEDSYRWVNALLARALTGRTWDEVIATDEKGVEWYAVYQRWQQSGLLEELSKVLFVRLDDEASDG